MQDRPPGHPYPGETGELLRWFDAEHQRVFHSPYLARFPRDAGLLGQALARYGYERATAMIGLFFDCHEEPRASLYGIAADRDDPRYWVGKTRPDVPGFVRQIPRLVQILAEE